MEPARRLAARGARAPRKRTGGVPLSSVTCDNNRLRADIQHVHAWVVSVVPVPPLLPTRGEPVTPLPWPLPWPLAHQTRPGRPTLSSHCASLPETPRDWPAALGAGFRLALPCLCTFVACVPPAPSNGTSDAFPLPRIIPGGEPLVCKGQGLGGDPPTHRTNATFFLSFLMFVKCSTTWFRSKIAKHTYCFFWAVVPDRRGHRGSASVHFQDEGGKQRSTLEGARYRNATRTEVEKIEKGFPTHPHGSRS